MSPNIRGDHELDVVAERTLLSLLFLGKGMSLQPHSSAPGWHRDADLIRSHLLLFIIHLLLGG